ncbi:oligopeptide/dipeptide ABC transporter ATP-binding protein [Nocardioides sp. NPDC058538]|uniref:oligopeptide/dipeptide ABC transporter ATP-binding protein n=1 Tax=Nocardioides sp. NPDC058538 TaxID=3346542 RepID=UPI003647490C
MTSESSVLTDDVLSAEHISIGFRRRRRAPVFQALDDVSLTVARGRTVGLVGESGSGKSTFAKAVLGLLPVDRGRITVAGHDVDGKHPDHRRLARHVQAVFQDPGGSLNPSYTVGRSIAEPLLAQAGMSRSEVLPAVTQALERVGLEPDAAQRLPRHFSGGQRQRICIARALVVAPELVVCDEAVSALDLSVQAQVLNLLMDLQDETGLSYLFISHDMNVVRRLCDDVTVLYRGQVMEQGPTRSVTSAPAHPYTRSLLLASPVADPTAQAERRAAAGRVPAVAAETATEAGTRCPFAARCPVATEVCRVERPPLREVPGGVSVACHRYPEWQHEIPPVPSGDAHPTGVRDAGVHLNNKEIN